MLIVTDLNNASEPLYDVKGITYTSKVSGEESLTFLILKTDRNSFAYPLINEECLIEDTDTGTVYRVKTCEEKSINDRAIKQINAQHIMFDMIDNHIYGTLSGAKTIQQALSFALNGTGYTYSIIDSFPTVDYENFGDDNSLALFQNILNDYNAEFTVSKKVLTIRTQIGNKTDIQFRYKHNLKAISKSVDSSNLSTYIKGFGKDGLTAEYTSPYQSIWGIRHAKPVRDDRYTTTSGLMDRLKREIRDTPEISFTIDFLDLRNAGYPYNQANKGDEVYVIYEPLGIDITARVMETVVKKDEKENVISSTVTLANFKNNLTDALADLGNTSKTVKKILNDNGTVRYNVLDEAVKIATEALQSARTELEFENGIIARDKDNPNFLVLFNSNGIGISRDGGATFKEAITSEGFVLSAGAIGQLSANNIQIGPTTTFEPGYDPTKVGGTNLYIGSLLSKIAAGWNANTVISQDDDLAKRIRIEWNGTGTSFGFQTHSEDRKTKFKLDQDYVLSFEVRGNVTDLSYTYFMRNEGANSPLGVKAVSLSTTNWTKVEFRRKSTWASDTGYLLLGSNDVAIGKWFEVRKVQIEEGDKATTWAPTPSDLQAASKSYTDGVRTDLRLSAPLPTSLTLDGNGIRATTSDSAKYAQLDYRGLYIKGGAIQIDGGLPDAQIANSSKWNEQGTYIDENGIYTGSLTAKQVKVGVDTTFEQGYDPTKIQVGGINLVKNTALDGDSLTGWAAWPGTDLSIYNFSLYGKGVWAQRVSGTYGVQTPPFYMQKDVIYTVSFLFQSRYNSGYEQDYNYLRTVSGTTIKKLSNYNLANFPNRFGSTAIWEVQFQISHTEDIPDARLLLGRTDNGGLTGQGFVISQFKVEVGTKKTTWDRNPEEIRENLRLSAPLPSSITMDANGITASTSTTDKYARMDYRGFYAKKGAIAVERSDGFLLINDGIANFDMAVQSGSPTYVDDYQYADGNFAVTIQGPYARLASSAYRRFDYLSFKHTARYLNISFYGRSGGGGAYTYVQVRDESNAVLATNMTNSTADTAIGVTIDLGVPNGQYRVFYIYFRTTDAAYPALLRMATKYLSG